MNNCSAPLHPQAIEGIRLFNLGLYFEAHEALESAWKEEKSDIRELYRGILQVAVVYLHITRKNYYGALKVYGRSRKWLKDWPETCRGVDVGMLRRDAQNACEEMQRLGSKNLAQFDRSLLRPVQWDEEMPGNKHDYTCDRCGYRMLEKNCKVTCPNCGNRFDCSDLNIYFD
jgi:predicted metal-dependent hydrolase